MFCTPPATTTSAVPDMTACAAKCTACCEEPHCRSMVVPGGPGDVARLRPHRVDAAEDHVLDRSRVDPGALDQRGQHGPAQVGRMDRGEPAATLANRGADGVHDKGLGHASSLPSACLDD